MLRNIKLIFMADFQLQVVEIIKNFYPVFVTEFPDNTVKARNNTGLSNK